MLHTSKSTCTLISRLESEQICCCIQRNYRYFFMFVSSTALLCLHVLVSCTINITTIIRKEHCTVWKAVEHSPVSGILIMYTFVICWFVGGLTTFHLYLISSNQTTYENFRYQYDRKMNPYNLGIARNCLEVFCYRIPRSKNNFRASAKGNSPVAFNPALYMAEEMAKRSLDMEMVRRQAVNADEFEDVRSRVVGLGRLERCSTEPRRDWPDKGNWKWALIKKQVQCLILMWIARYNPALLVWTGQEIGLLEKGKEAGVILVNMHALMLRARFLFNLSLLLTLRTGSFLRLVAGRLCLSLELIMHREKLLLGISSTLEYRKHELLHC